MVDFILGSILLFALTYAITWFVCRFFRIPLEKYEQMIIQSKIGQKLSKVKGEEYFMYFIIVIFIAVLYDNITTCNNDPLGIRECKQVDYLEYDSYKGRR